MKGRMNGEGTKDGDEGKEEEISRR